MERINTEEDKQILNEDDLKSEEKTD